MSAGGSPPSSLFNLEDALLQAAFLFVCVCGGGGHLRGGGQTWRQSRDARLGKAWHYYMFTGVTYRLFPHVNSAYTAVI